MSLQPPHASADNPRVLPPSRQLLAHIYLLAAGLTGAIVGYTISRIETRFEIGAITRSVQNETARRESVPPTVAVIDTKESVVAVSGAPQTDNNTISIIEPVPPMQATAKNTKTMTSPAQSQFASPVQTPTPPTDDLELAARRLDERARTADRLGDPKLADLWKAEAARLRSIHAARLAQSTSDAE